MIILNLILNQNKIFGDGIEKSLVKMDTISNIECFPKKLYNEYFESSSSIFYTYYEVCITNDINKVSYRLQDNEVFEIEKLPFIPTMATTIKTTEIFPKSLFPAFVEKTEKVETHYLRFFAPTEREKRKKRNQNRCKKFKLEKLFAQPINNTKQENKFVNIGEAIDYLMKKDLNAKELYEVVSTFNMEITPKILKRFLNSNPDAYTLCLFLKKACIKNCTKRLRKVFLEGMPDTLDFISFWEIFPEERTIKTFRKCIQESKYACQLVEAIQNYDYFRTPKVLAKLKKFCLSPSTILSILEVFKEKDIKLLQKFFNSCPTDEEILELLYICPWTQTQATYKKLLRTKPSRELLGIYENKIAVYPEFVKKYITKNS